MAEPSWCLILSVLVAVYVFLYGFSCVLRKKLDCENDLQVVHRQLRGFAYVLIAGAIVKFARGICE